MNPYESVPQSDSIEAGAETNAPASSLVRDRPGWLESSWRGAKLGLRCALYVFGPIAYLVIVLSTALTAFGMGSGRGFGLHPTFLSGFGILFGSALYGMFLGAVVGLIGSAIPWKRIKSPFVGFRTFVRRVFRLRSRPEKEIASPRVRRGRWLWIGLWLAGSFALLLQATAFGVGVYFGRLVDQRLTRAIAEADRVDPNWRLDDLLATRDSVPDEENSALVVAEALALLPERWPFGPFLVPGRPNPPVTEVGQAFERLTANEDNVQLDGQTVEVLRRELDDYEEAVQLARTLVKYNRGRHEVELGSTLINTSLAETEGARTPARLMEVDAALRAHDGDLDGALDSCRAAFANGRSIGDEPFLISFLVRGNRPCGHEGRFPHSGSGRAIRRGAGQTSVARPGREGAAASSLRSER